MTFSRRPETGDNQEQRDAFAVMVDLCYRLVQFFGYPQDSLTIEFQ